MARKTLLRQGSRTQLVEQPSLASLLTRAPDLHESTLKRFTFHLQRIVTRVRKLWIRKYLTSVCAYNELGTPFAEVDHEVFSNEGSSRLHGN